MNFSCECKHYHTSAPDHIPMHLDTDFTNTQTKTEKRGKRKCPKIFQEHI